MNDLHIKEFESKLRSAFKPKCEISVWSIEGGYFIGYEIRRGRNRYWQDDFLASGLSTAYDVEINVRAIANELPASWCAVLLGGTGGR
jgi:hypothetical protein